MKTLILSFSILLLFVNPDTKTETKTSKKYYSYAVSWDVKNETAYFSPIRSCQFEENERTQSQMGVIFKSFESQWNLKVEAIYNLSLYKYEFGGWFETLGEADQKRDEKISFFKNKLGYKVYTQYDFGFYPKCQ